MFIDVSKELISGGFGSLIFLVGFICSLVYLSKNYVRRDMLDQYVTFERLNKNLSDYVHHETHEKDLQHQEKLINEQLKHIKKGIEDIKIKLEKVND